MIHSIGDSHSDFTFRGIPGVAIHHLGPLTMKRAAHADDYFLNEGVREIGLLPSDTLIVSAGEGDVRCFLKPELDAKQITPAALLPPLVDRYLDRVRGLEVNGARVGVLSITPPVTYTAVHAFRQVNTYQFPPTGTDAERAEYTRVLNDLLAHGCQTRGLLFIDTYSEYVDDDGMLIAEQSDGQVHIGDTSQVHVLLIRMGLLHE
jgi:hypothetical protein